MWCCCNWRPKWACNLSYLAACVFVVLKYSAMSTDVLYLAQSWLAKDGGCVQQYCSIVATNPHISPSNKALVWLYQL